MKIQQPPTEDTEQEKHIQNVLDELGLRYASQFEIGNRIVDFFIADGDIVIEADGIYGHFKKSDKKRDAELRKMGIQTIIHIRSENEEEIIKIISEELCRQYLE